MMEIEFDKELYMDQCSLFFSFLLRKKQWSGISNADYIRWCNNFDQIDEGKYIGTRILNSLLYYSEDDLLKLLDDAIMGIFENEIILPLQISSNFNCLPSQLEYAVKEAIPKTILMPSIEDLMDPGASGPEIIRDVRNHFRPKLQTIFNDNLSTKAEYDRVIIIDDCIGSGKQCETFWTTAKIQEGKLLRDWAAETKTKAYYIALVGYKKAVQELREKYTDLTIVCAEYISDHHQIFSDKSSCWKDKDEQMWAQDKLGTRVREVGVSLLGHSDLSFAVALHKTIPDWSLPALYKNKSDWKHLIERKNTYD